MYSRVFVVVDALDECQASDGYRASFLLEIFRLQAKYGSNIFATSRFVPEVVEKFNGSIRFEIRAHDEDVRKYLDSQISRSGLRLLQNYREEIKTNITKVVDGMFLLAQLHFEATRTKRTLKKIKDALNNLPAGPKAYDDAYKEAMKRIKGHDSDSEELAMQVLSWITCAKRPLTISELRHAMAVEIDKFELDEENLPEIEDVISVCTGLVTVDKESNIIRLAHYTTQEYFQRTQSNWFPNAEAEITTICVTCLSFSVFESGICQADNEFEERLRLNQLYDYATHNWGYHACKTSTLSQAVIDFLENKAEVEASSQGLLATKFFASHSHYSQEYPRQMTGLHLAAYFGVKEAIRALLKKGIQADLMANKGLMPFSFITANGYRARLLLEQGAELDSKDENSRTPLLFATEKGQEAVVRLLLEQTVKLDSKAIR